MKNVHWQWTSASMLLLMLLCIGGCESEAERAARLQRERDAAMAQQLAGLWIGTRSGWFGEQAWFLRLRPEGSFEMGIDRDGSGLMYKLVYDTQTLMSGKWHVANGKVVMTAERVDPLIHNRTAGDTFEEPVASLSDATVTLGGDILRRRRE